MNKKVRKQDREKLITCFTNEYLAMFLHKSFSTVGKFIECLCTSSRSFLLDFCDDVICSFVCE